MLKHRLIFMRKYARPLLFSLSLIIVVSVTTTVFATPSWTERTASGSRLWFGFAMSTNGATIIAADNTDTSSSLYKSTDGGVTWNAVTNGGSAYLKRWKFVACSSDCSTILATELSGNIYLSTDGGSNWTTQTGAGTGSWTGVAVSSDGSVLAAIANPGASNHNFWVSTNGGSSWSNPSDLDLKPVNAIAMSSDGTKMVVGMFGDYAYTTSNTGTSWTARTNSPSTFWTGVDMSSDGTKIVGVTKFNDGHPWTSTDSGANWTERSGAGTGGAGQWQAVSSSGDGSKIIAVAFGGDVKTSTDSGANWTATTDPGTNGAWRNVAYSSDGTYIALGGVSTNIWTYGDTIVVAPTMTASAPSSVTTTTATFNGNITSTGNANPTTRGFHYGTTTGYGTTTSTSGSYSTGAYTASITGLTCNTTYHYESFATNTAGSGDSTDVSFTTSACPVAPTVTTSTTTASITHSGAILTGNITDTGGENPTSRYIKYGTTSGVYPNQSPTDSGSFSTGSFTESLRGLTAGTTYYYLACATNGGGTGCGAVERSFTTLSAPGAPTSLSGTAGYTQASLSWTAPVSSGDYSITDYLIEYKTTAGGSYYVWPHTASTDTSAIVTGLTNGVSYTFRVSAVSAAGAGTASSTTAVTPSSTPTAPNAPTGLTGTGGSGQVALSWTAPTVTGGAAITDYTIEYRVLGAGSYTTFSHVAGTATSRTVTGLTNGTGYNFRVSAVNSVGTGTASSVITVGAGSSIYRHILNTGQSLAEGVNSAPALSTTQPYSNKSLSNGPIAGITAPLIALIEGVVARESPSSARANYLAASMSGNPTIIDTIHSGGGQTYASIKKGGTGGYYATGQTQASVAKSETTAAGAYYLPFGVTIVHGESDQIASTSQSAYAGYMAQMQADYESDWNALTNRSDTIPLFESQMNTNSLGYIAAAQLDAHRDNPGKVILIGPKYQYEYAAADHLHLTNTSSRLLGEMFGKVMKKVLVDGTTWSPLMPVSITNIANVVTIDYHIPAGQLAVDTTLVAARTNKGFEFYQTGGSAISISSVALDATNTKVVITLSGTPDGTNPHIRYAWGCEFHPDDAAFGTCGDPATTGYVGGNIRDTDTTTSPSSNGSGTALYDWGVAFDDPITSATVPDAPTALAVTPGDTQAALSWTAPEDDGGSVLTDYYIEYKTAAASTWSAFSHVAGTTASATVTGLTNGTNYMFRVSAVNAYGTGASTAVSTATPVTTPGAPTSLSATGGIQQAVLTWTAPVSDGGAIITDYVVEYKLSADSSWTTFSDGFSQTTGTTVTGLASGSDYNFRVYTVTTAGTSSASGTANATTDATSAPGAPTSLGATVGNTQISLSWTAPVSNGGSAITDYLVEYNSGSGWNTFTDGVGTGTTATVTGLTNGTSYDFRVSAINAIGTGTASGTATATPATTPGAPTSLSATAGNVQVALTWVAPVSTGGSAITDYLVEYNDGGGWTTFADGTSTTASTTVTGLTNGTSYDFRVSAINSVGTGSASSTATATPVTTPGAPTSLVATRGNTQVALTWVAPVSTGGSAITDYLVEYNDGGGWTTFADGTSTTASATVTGLTNGTSYDFRVSTINVVGTGSASSTATATPATTPGAPTSLASTHTSTQAALTWTAPVSTGGSAITDYVVEYKLTSDSSWTTFADGTSATTGATVTGLTNGVSYDFRVSTTNAVGTGSVSSTVSSTFVIVPGVPTSLSATAGNGQVSLSWTAPASTGGASITDYLVEYATSIGLIWATFTDGVSTSTSATVTGLTNDTSYDFRVSAINSAGTGSASSTATATPAVPVVVTSSNHGFPYELVYPKNGGRGGVPTYISPIDQSTQNCPAFTKNVTKNAKLNSPAEVALWQAFLNKEMNVKIPVIGIYGPMTTKVVNNFQKKYKMEILTPGGLKNPTGTIYGYTRAKANKLLGCTS